MLGETYTANATKYPITIFVLNVCPQFDKSPSIDFEYVIYNDNIIIKLCHRTFVRTELGI